MKKILLFSALALASFAFKGDKKAYQVFDAKGTPVAYDDLLQAASKADIVFFGELHDNPICHWLELELAKDLHDTLKNKLVLGAEMFESDQQIALNEYLDGTITEKTFTSGLVLWGNYGTDYKPLVEFAKEQHLPFIADNIPRRYANMVYNRGLTALDSIDKAAKKWIAPLPVKYDSTVQAYKEIYENAGGHGGQNLPKSQAVKDATMAHFILQNWKPGQTFLHYNGAYHSNNHSGIVWYLKQKNPKLKILVISSVTQDKVDALETDNQNLGDFIIAVPERMTRTMQ